MWRLYHWGANKAASTKSARHERDVESSFRVLLAVLLAAYKVADIFTNMVLEYIHRKRIFAFEIIHKSTWHMNTILLFVEKE